jgi:hypothetical protein
VGGGREKPVGNLLLPLIRSHLARGTIEPFVYHLRLLPSIGSQWVQTPRHGDPITTSLGTSAWRAEHF